MSNPTIELTVSDMTCGHCKASVEKALAQVPGVAGCAIDLATKHVSVQTDGSVSPEAVVAAIDDAGFTATTA